MRSLDVMQEQALKVLQTVDRTFAEVNEIARGMSDEDIRVEEPRLHRRLASIVATMPQLHAIMLVGRNGRPLAASAVAPVPDNVNFGDRDYFQVQRDGDPGTYVSDMRSPRLPGIGSDFFDLSQRLESPDGAFNGVIAVAVRPSYFEDFYRLIGQTHGSYALVRDDGALSGAVSRSGRPGAASEHGEPAAARDLRRSGTGSLYPRRGQFGDRRHFPPGRLSQASGLSGLCGCRREHGGDPRRVAFRDGAVFDLRHSRHAPHSRGALACAAPDEAAL